MKKFLMVITPLFFLITIYLIVDTYSLFESNHLTTTNISLGKWQILINGTEVDPVSSNFTIDAINWDENTFVKEGKVAPGMSGYFDIEINANTTDVSVRYDITFDFSNLNQDQISIESITEINDYTLTKTGENTYTGVILLEDIQDSEVHTIRVVIAWDNDEDNNDIDSALGSVFDNTIEIPITVDVEQYFGELIEEY